MRLIDADVFMKEINKRIQELLDLHRKTSTTEIKLRTEEAIVTFCEALLMVKKIPSAQKTGRWIIVSNGLWRCSECEETSCCNSPFCGDCGAYMKGEEDGTVN